MKYIENKHIKIFAIFLIFTVVLFVGMEHFGVDVLADVGNTFSGGGSSSRSSSGGSRSYTTNGSGLFMIVYYFMLIPFPFNFIIIGLILFFTVYAKGERNNRQEVYNFDPNPLIDEDAVVSKIRANDPDFSKNVFLAFVRNVFICVQEAWEQKKWETIRPFESNELFELHSRQLQEYIDKNLDPHLDGQEIHSAMIVNYSTDGKYEYVLVKLCASLYDYTTNIEGKIVEGTDENRLYREYKLKFKRVLGVKTLGHEMKTTNCPNCGAPNNITSSGKCEYCNSIITTGEYGFVLDEYSRW